MKILICNVGSTSLKFKLREMPGHVELAEGRVERVGSEQAIFQYEHAEYRERLEPVHIPNYTAGIRRFLDLLTRGESPALSDLSQIEAVGFKTTISKDHYGVHELTEEVLEGMRAYLPVAPLHNRCYLEAIEVFRNLTPEARLVGVFETAFHQTISLENRIYPVPYEWYEKYGVMKMGYHGASHSYIAQKLAGRRRIISCHLGGSGSICAILDGKSIDNSFGFSLQAGIPHATRTGDMDAYIIPFMLEQGLTMDQILQGLGENGGLKGISGTSGDMRDIEAAIQVGSDRARLALNYMAGAILRYIGAYIMELGGLDALAFTGGIGENCVRLRKMVLDGMRFMGVQYDAEKNESGSGDRKIPTDDSSEEVFVILANEEYVVVNETYANCIKNK